MTGEYAVRVPVSGRPLDPEVLRRAVTLGLLALYRQDRLAGAIPAGPVEAELASFAWGPEPA